MHYSSKRKRFITIDLARISQQDLHEKANFIVGGPSRCGKTTLVDMLFKQSGRVVGLPVEGLLHIFYQRSYPLLMLQRRIVIEEYLNQPRITNEARTKRGRPIEFFDADVKDIASKIPGCVAHQLQLIAFCLDLFAQERGSEAWAVCDIHAERFFEMYQKWLSNLQLVMMLRDPREAACAALYWRNYPKPNPFIPRCD